MRLRFAGRCWSVLILPVFMYVLCSCSRLPRWGRGPALLVDEEMEEEDVEISDDDEPMPVLTTRRKRGASARSSRGVLPMLSPDVVITFLKALLSLHLNVCGPRPMF